MCLILDPNVAGDYIKGHKYIMPVKKWIENDDRLIYTKSETWKRELKFNSRMYILLGQYREDGRAIEFPAEEVQKEQNKLANCKLFKSKDFHIVALANVSGVRLLVTNDINLIKDFKNSAIIKHGKIYRKETRQNKRQSLLDSHKCNRKYPYGTTRMPS